MLENGERFLSFEEFPWFKKARIEDLTRVERPHPGHLVWPQLDVDLSLDSINNPSQFPLIAREEARSGAFDPADTMLDHVTLNVTDFDRSFAFYRAALATLGIEPILTFEGRAAGFGTGGKPYFWIARRDPVGQAHVAFATDRATVDAFHREALAAGGRDHGGPGLRPQYHERYYGAFVLDPDGHNIEAVCHQPG